MFIVSIKHLFWWPVSVLIPDPDKAGAFRTVTFEMQFEALPISRAEAIDAAREALPADDRAARSLDYLFELARDWRDVVDERNNPVPFSRESFAAQLDFPWFRRGVLAAYQEAVTGQAARLGN